MSEETALATVPSIGNDQLLAVAEAAEKRIDAVNRIKGLALRVTNHQDWTDQGGKPYLQVSGSEKVARLFGISWRLNEPQREEHDDGHYSYSIKGFFNMGTAEIEVVGTRSSKDPFFSRNGKVPVSEIDRNDVKKGAMTNCIGNGITRLLGIRNLTWEEVRSGGVNQSQVSKVEYKKQAKPEDGLGERPVAQAAAHNAGDQQSQDAPAPAFVWRLGKHKGESIATVPDDYLDWFMKNGKVQDHVDQARMELDRRNAQASFAEEGAE